MPVIAVVNRKGGSGKSTLATHLAGYFAHCGLGVMLGDVDRQQSTVPWLRRRAALALPSTAMVGWAVDPKNVLRPPAGVSHVVIDTPGGLQGLELARVLMFADVVLMPVCDSAFDRESAADGLAEIRRHPRVVSGRCKLAAVGMRIDARTSGQQRLRDWAAKHKLDFIGVLRETQTYVRCVERGVTVFDLPPSRVQADLDQWQPILEWLAPLLSTPAPAQAPQRPLPAAPHKAAPMHGAAAQHLAVLASARSVDTGSGLRRLLGWLLPPRTASRARP